MDKNEIQLNSKKYIVSKTDSQGMIEYGNDYFVEISGYSEAELVGRPHNILRHPDMPKIIFKLMWDKINNGQNIVALVKNRAKDGRYYWVLSEIEPKKDAISGEIISHLAYRKAAPRKAVEEISKIYAKLLEIETKSGILASEKYLQGFLESKNQTYAQYIDSIIDQGTLTRLFFSAMKKLFN